MEKNRFNILDPFRFVAAMAVLLYHYAIYLDGKIPNIVLHAFSFGYLGVNFFFLLSGFVISASAQNRNALDFLVSRAIRLYPAFWICLLFTVIIAYIFKGKIFPIADIFINASILNDYVGVSNIDGVYWTLQAEIKFYACICLLIVTGLIKYLRLWLSVWLLLAILHHYLGQPFFLGWFISPEYSFYFIGGVCCYYLYANKNNYFLFIILVISAIYAVIKSSKQIYNFYPSAVRMDEIIVAIIVASFFVFFYFLSLGFFNLQRRSWFLLLGTISYPLYLIHNRAGKAVIEATSDLLGSLMSVILVTLGIVLASLVINVFLERKFSLRLQELFRRWKDG